MTNTQQSPPKYKRKRLFVDKKVQGSLVRQLILHWALVCVLLFFYLFAIQAFSNGFSLSFQENLAEVWSKYGVLGLVMLVLSPVFIYDSIKLSNRFVGPMVSFRNALGKLASGENPPDVKFRQNDFWKELAKDLNRVNTELAELRAKNAAAPNQEHVGQA